MFIASSRRKCVIGVLSFLLSTSTLAAPARADYTILPDKADNRGIWEGWGCSICWWGNGVGKSAYQDLYADLFFTTRTVSFLDKSLPGLGMNIVRYNIGGGGKNDNVGDLHENIPANFPWFKDIDGYWINGNSADPQSANWDWSRDENQRSVLAAAKARGVNYFEFFANAPMWWMTEEKSSAGGKLSPTHRRDFMRYIATVARYSRDHWGITPTSIEPFNEPSAWWWKYPGGQECCPIPRNEQAELLGYLREDMSAEGLKGVELTASDENSVGDAIGTCTYFNEHSVPVKGKQRTVSSLVGKINAHSYYGQNPWRDNEGRKRLRQLAGTKRIWMSEYGDPDGDGMVLAQTIMEDLNYVRPSAWIYWQPVEPYSGWGLVNGDYAKSASAPDRAKPTWVYTKYWVMAQFTRFLRPGYRIIGSNDNNTIVAYSDKKKELVLITVNYDKAQEIRYDLSGLKKTGAAAAITHTNTDYSALLQESEAPVNNKTLVISAKPKSVYSIVLRDVTL